MSAPILENDIDREFGPHKCPICGTDCSYVSNLLDEKSKRIAALEAQNKTLLEVVSILHQAMDDKKAGAWIRARRWLDKRDIYHGDLQENAVLAELCRAALAATEPK